MQAQRNYQNQQGGTSMAGLLGRPRVPPAEAFRAFQESEGLPPVKGATPREDEASLHEEHEMLLDGAVGCVLPPQAAAITATVAMARQRRSPPRRRSLCAWQSRRTATKTNEMARKRTTKPARTKMAMMANGKM